MEEIPKRITHGYSVQLGEIGTLRLSLSSEGVDDTKHFNPRTIKKKVIFLPSKAFKSELKNISFEYKK
jgi:putative DNA-binding protein